ncbi:YhcN/YlaJ family sporulation lipoprotein [Brevibacillus nitrificans]|uniref:YhcN/YlaJ family sporulation lipoprotein n=1 Tax=Brevibacillus nitrificans TaxID=651560 RepID=UPI00285DA448|nr:YhcN/YlaJ family sporulation lipoprotein [Brevibacillus nitrificans]MDR7315545.1 hypothetical protein [Brevibacillus nitrificans]
MRTILLVASLCLFTAGCSPQANQQAKTQSAAQDPCQPTPIRYSDSEQKAKAITEQVSGIDKAVAVRIDDELDVAIKVSNFNRFRLESIEKEVAQKLKSSFPDTKIHVTSDKRLIMDLQQLSDTPWTNNQEDACKHKKTLKKIEDDMKG